MKDSTAAHFNQLARELREDPRALEKQFSADFGRVLGGITPPRAVEPMDAVDGAQLQEGS